MGTMSDYRVNVSFANHRHGEVVTLPDNDAEVKRFVAGGYISKVAAAATDAERDAKPWLPPITTEATTEVTTEVAEADDDEADDEDAYTLDAPSLFDADTDL